MPEFLEIVKSTHQSLLSDDVLAHFGETKNPSGTYKDKAKFSRRSILPQREDTPVLQKARAGIAAREVVNEDGRKSKEPTEIVSAIAHGVQNNKHWALKDPVRNADTFAGDNPRLRAYLAVVIERPLNEAGSIYAGNIKRNTAAFLNKMDDLDIKTGAESAAVMRWGEGFYQDEYGDRQPYTLQMLQEQFPDKWRNIQKAADVCRDIYDGYADDMNAMLAEIYPNVIEHAEERADKLQEYVDRAEEKAKNQRRVIASLEIRIEQKVKEIEGKKRTDTQAYANLQNSLADLRARLENAEALLENYEERAEIRKEQKRDIEASIESGEVLRNRRVVKRADYFHHFKETYEGIEQLKHILNEDREISPQLAGIMRTAYAWRSRHRD